MKKPIKPEKLQSRDFPNLKDDRYLFKLIGSSETHGSYDDFIRMIESLPAEEIEIILSKNDFFNIYFKIGYSYYSEKPTIEIYSKLSDQESNDLFKRDEKEYKEKQLKYESDLRQYEVDVRKYNEYKKKEKIKKLEDELQKLKGKS